MPKKYQILVQDYSKASTPHDKICIKKYQEAPENKDFIDFLNQCAAQTDEICKKNRSFSNRAKKNGPRG